MQGVRVEVWGDRALFTRPEMKVERVSYDVMTPSAARGILEAIYWHPGMRYVIDEIHVLNKIKFANVLRNELSNKISDTIDKELEKGKLPHAFVRDQVVQRASMILTDVHYVISAHFEMPDKAAPGDNPGKFIDMMRRRINKGQCYFTPYFGTREFSAFFKPYEGQWPPQGYYSQEGERDLGFMLFDMDYTDPENITPQFFRAKMHNGVIRPAKSEVVQ